MPADEFSELREHAEHARLDPDLAPVSLTMAILAVLVATVSLLGHRAHTEEVVLQNRVTNQWAYFQAKNIRRHSDERFADLALLLDAKDPQRAAQLREIYLAEAKHYQEEERDLDAEARRLAQEGEQERQRANRYDLGEVFLEVALVIMSITLLSGRKVFWWIGMLSGAIGMLIAAIGAIIR